MRIPKDPHELTRFLMRTVAAKTGLLDTRDAYFFFARIGSNYDDYKFEWEPFRDLAGPLEPGDRAIPVLVISNDEDRTAPEIEKVEAPAPHVQMWINPGLGAGLIANAWLELLAQNHASHGDFEGPFDWFLESLNLSLQDLTSTSRTFLFM